MSFEGHIDQTSFSEAPAVNGCDERRPSRGADKLHLKIGHCGKNRNLSHIAPVFLAKSFNQLFFLEGHNEGVDDNEIDYCDNARSSNPTNKKDPKNIMA